MKFLEYIKAHIWNVILAIFIVALVVAAIVIVIKDKDNEQQITDNPERSEIVDEFQPQPEAANPITDIRGEPNVLGSEAPAPTPAPTPTTPPATVTFKTYINNTLGFSASVPTDAVVKETSNEAKAGSTSQGGLYWTVTVFFNTNETLESLENQMRSSPDLASIAHVTLDGKPALQFTSPNLNGATGYALINKGKLYYIVGNFSNPEILASFKFF